VRGRDFVAMAADGHRLGPAAPDCRGAWPMSIACSIWSMEDTRHAAVIRVVRRRTQRLLLAQCLLGNPKLLLLTNP